MALAAFVVSGGIILTAWSRTWRIPPRDRATPLVSLPSPEGRVEEG